VLWLDSAAAPDNPLKGGVIFTAMEARPWPQGTESIKSPYLGSFNLLSLHAFLVGKTIVGIRTDDVLRTVDWLFANEHPTSFTIHGIGALGIVALHAAVLDERISRVEVDNSLTSYRSIVDVPLHRNVSEVVIPGVLRKYDVPDLVRALAPRPVVATNPVDGAGSIVK
jgi:hypothetical protein